MYILPTTVAIIASVQAVVRHSLGWRLRLVNAPVIMNVAAIVNRSCQTPVDPYAAIAGSTELLAAGQVRRSHNNATIHSGVGVFHPVPDDRSS